ncbi:MAG: SOS response-associated peptidase [Lentimicrobiaceae bacterium]|nr:SOS response-associated peptidase [Lentimicrobiaceae bacterium]
MCFRTSLSIKHQELAKKYGKLLNVIEMYKEVYSEKYHISAFQNPPYPVITADPYMQTFNWGLIPPWTKTITDAEKIRKMTYNARSETIFEKPSFRKPILYNRCIIPATGYFEHHQNPDNSKTPFFIHPVNNNLFSFAGIYDKWTNPETNLPLFTFSIITTPANDLTAYIHNSGANSKRMPLILNPNNEQYWLQPHLSTQDIKNLMQPFPAHEMTAYPINNDFLKKPPTDPTILNAA